MQMKLTNLRTDQVLSDELIKFKMRSIADSKQSLEIDCNEMWLYVARIW